MRQIFLLLFLVLTSFAQGGINIIANRIGPENVVANFTAQTSVNITHNLNTLNIIVDCRTSGGAALADTISAKTVNSVTLTFGGSSTGSCTINGTGGVGPQGPQGPEGPAGAGSSLGTITGIVKASSGVPSAAVAGTDYQAPITLTTTGTSGAATLIGNTLNVPQYSGGGGGTNYQAVRIFTGADLTARPRLRFDASPGAICSGQDLPGTTETVVTCGPDSLRTVLRMTIAERATLVPSPVSGTTVVISDGVNSTDCTTGGNPSGSSVLCRYNGTTWVAQGGGSTPTPGFSDGFTAGYESFCSTGNSANQGPWFGSVGWAAGLNGGTAVQEVFGSSGQSCGVVLTTAATAAAVTSLYPSTSSAQQPLFAVANSNWGRQHKIWTGASVGEYAFSLFNSASFVWCGASGNGGVSGCIGIVSESGGAFTARSCAATFGSCTDVAMTITPAANRAYIFSVFRTSAGTLQAKVDESTDGATISATSTVTLTTNIPAIAAARGGIAVRAATAAARAMRVEGMAWYGAVGLLGAGIL